MELRGILIICFLGIGLALMAVPVSAGTPIAILGTIPPAVSITVTTPAAGTLTAGATTYYASTITATSNVPYTISVSDLTGRAAPLLGNMSAVTLAAPTIYLGSGVLTTPISVAGTTQTVPVITAYTAGGAGHGINATAQEVYSSSASIASYPLPLTITQPVTLTDTVLPANQEYRIDLTFTIAST